MAKLFAGLMFVTLAVVNINGDNHDIAMSACMGLAESGTYSAAIPRNCYETRSCDNICVAINMTQGHLPKSASLPRCINSLHIYSNPGPKNTFNTKWLNSWIFGSSGCSKTTCGPNYCCCTYN
ncbi:uncharacterized protein LOC125676165 [Ostrea edulis]|uniref:uncharacterized protein LOC125676165 n=1 Tax=Ostrea edulis TaxID=37623 RepID=UPI002095D645|nr:uncharacterized protein LOC125676165 [Ostrea edulis]